MKRAKTGKRYELDFMPGYSKMMVQAIRGADALDLTNLENMDEDPKAASDSLDRLVEVKEWGWYYDLVMVDERDEDKDQKDKRPKWDWNKVLSEDLNLILAAMKAATYGPVMTLDMVCSLKCHTLLGRWKERIPIHELEVTQYDRDVLLDFTDYNRTRVIPESVLGYEIEYSLEAHPDRKVEVPKGATRMEKYAAAMTSSVVRVDEQLEDDEGNWHDIGTDPDMIKEWILDLPLSELEAVVDHIQEISASAGIQKEWRCACPNPQCREVHILPLPFVLSSTSPSYVEPGLNLPYIRGLRSFRGSSLFQALKQLDTSCRNYPQQGKAAALE